MSVEEAPARRGKRANAQDFEIAGVAFLTLASFAKKIGRPLPVVRAWTRLPQNALPVVRLPSAYVGSGGQSQHVEEPVALAWVKSHASDAPKPPKGRSPGRPPHSAKKR